MQTFKLYIQNNWHRQTQVVLTISATICSFWLLPSNMIIRGRQSGWLVFVGLFILAVVWLLISAPVQARRFNEDAGWWRRISLITAVLSVIAFSCYGILTTKWVIYSERYKEWVLIGSEFTDSLIENKIEEEKMLSERTISESEAIGLLNKMQSKDVLTSVGGNVYSAWTWGSMFHRRLVLITIYIIGLPAFCITLISAVQTGFCSKALGTAIEKGNSMKDFFISYNKADRQWAEWIAWILEDAGYSVVIQAWDFRPGGNFVLEMQKAAVHAERTIAVLSTDYLNSEYTHPEWAAAFAHDPQGQKRLLVPFRVRKCNPEGLLGQQIYVDLVGLAEEDARISILGAFSQRAKPSQPPAFPGISKSTAQNPVPYPGDSTAIPTVISTFVVEESTGSITSQESRQGFAKNSSNTYRDRLDLHRKLNSILVQEFNMLIFTLNPPAGVIPSMPASQGDRASALLIWAESPRGCGLNQLLSILEDVLQS